MIHFKDFDAQIERVDGLPVVYGLLKQMHIQVILDKIIPRHGNWQGLSAGWVTTIWLIHILSAQPLAYFAEIDRAKGTSAQLYRRPLSQLSILSAQTQHLAGR